MLPPLDLSKVKLTELDLPQPRQPTTEPQLPAREYNSRIARVKAQMKKHKFDALVIYGDREHVGNITYLCGFDPRFEEAVLVIGREASPTLLLGNEGVSYAKIVVPLKVRIRLVQYFSLMGQPRGKTGAAAEVFRESGIRKGMRVGVVGWKYYTTIDFDNPETAIEAPSYLVDALREVTGSESKVVNAGSILMNPGDGLRTVHSVGEIASFEYAATIASINMHNLITGLREGISEYEAVELMRLNGMPLNSHIMVSSGERARVGLCSPSARIIKRGDQFTAGVGIRGTFVCCAAYVVENDAQLERIQPTYLSKICIPYFGLLDTWYKCIRIDVSCDSIVRSIGRYLRSVGMRLALNPGHLVDFEEWPHSPFYSGSPYLIRAGMMIQSDMIPLVHSDQFGVNVEDTIAIGDKSIRESLKDIYPETWSRIERRREFMSQILGIDIAPEVLPMCDEPAVLRPFLLAKNKALTIAS